MLLCSWQRCVNAFVSKYALNAIAARALFAKRNKATDQLDYLEIPGLSECQSKCYLRLQAACQRTSQQHCAAVLPLLQCATFGDIVAEAHSVDNASADTSHGTTIIVDSDLAARECRTLAMQIWCAALAHEAVHSFLAAPPITSEQAALPALLDSMQRALDLEHALPQVARQQSTSVLPSDPVLGSAGSVSDLQLVVQPPLARQRAAMSALAAIADAPPLAGLLAQALAAEQADAPGAGLVRALATLADHSLRSTQVCANHVPS